MVRRLGLVPFLRAVKKEVFAAVDTEQSISEIDMENDFDPTVTASTPSEEERQM